MVKRPFHFSKWNKIARTRRCRGLDNRLFLCLFANTHTRSVRACERACVRACARARVCACVRACECACVRACVRANALVFTLYKLRYCLSILPVLTAIVLWVWKKKKMNIIVFSLIAFITETGVTTVSKPHYPRVSRTPHHVPSRQVQRVEGQNEIIKIALTRTPSDRDSCSLWLQESETAGKSRHGNGCAKRQVVELRTLLKLRHHS